MDIQLELNKVLVIAFQKQHPYQDGEVAANLEEHARHYRQRVAKNTSGFDQADSFIPGVRLFEPASCLLWGDYDFASFFLSDDFESIASIAMGCDAISQEFLFGSPYAVDGCSMDDALANLFLRDACDRPLIAITRLKLADHLSFAGVDLRRAMVRYISNVVAQSDLKPIFLRCWAWPELVVILQGKDPVELTEALREIEHCNVGALCSASPELKSSFVEALRHKVPFYLLRLWLRGRDINRRRPRNCREDLLPDLMMLHPTVAMRTQIGVLEAGWPERLERKPSTLLQGIAYAFQPHQLERVKHEKAFTRKTLLGELRKRREIEFKNADRKPFYACIAVRVKPGHSHIVERFASSIWSEVESHGHVSGSKSQVLHAGIGEETVLTLEMAVSPDLHGFMTLLCVSHSFRICGGVRRHLLDVSTQIHWPPSSRNAKQGDHKTRDNEALSRSGFALFGQEWPVAMVEFERGIRRQHWIGNVEELSMRSWADAVSRITTRPEMLGSVIEIYRSAQSINWALHEHETLESTEKEDNVSTRRLVAKAAFQVGGFLQRAYQQRLQFSPVMGGAPPFNGQTPYGTNQIVRMLDGVISVIMHTALIADGSWCQEPDRPWRANVVVFGSGASIATANVAGFNILRLNLLQAWTPVSLCLLFHELGHFMVQWHHWREGRNYDPQNRPTYEGFQEKSEEWIDATLSAYQAIEAKMNRLGIWDPKREEAREWRRDLSFLEDIFAHAVWRRVGCGGSWKLFKSQFLIGQGMGMRTSVQAGLTDPVPDLHEPQRVLDLWAESVAHLVVQRALDRCQDNVADAFREIPNLLAGDEVDQIIAEAWPFFAGELQFCADFYKKNLSEDQLKEALGRSFKMVWWGFLIALAQFDIPERNDTEETDTKETDTEEVLTLKLYMDILASLFSHLAEVSDRLEQCESRLRRENKPFQEIEKRIMKGQSVVRELPWEMISQEVGGGPTATAVVWVREILRNVTESFKIGLDGKRPVASVRRGRSLRFEGISHGGVPDGVFVDFLGGTLSAGIEARRHYLQVRLAAIESLSAVAGIVLTGSIGLRLERSRNYRRREMNGGITRVTIPGTGDSFEARVLNQSAAGACLEALPEFASTIKKLSKGDFLLVQSTDGIDTDCRIARIKRKQRILGIERLGRADKTPPSEKKVKPAGATAWIHLRP